MNEELLNGAKEALASEKYHQAVLKFEELYKESPTEELNIYLSNAYYLDNQFVAAERIVLESIEAYLAEEPLFNFFQNVLIKNDSFILLREIIGTADFPGEYKERVLEKISSAEIGSSSNMAETNKKIANQFYHMADEPISVQIARFQAAKKLPLLLWLKSARFLLLDPFIHPIIRSSVLESMQKMRLQEKVNMYWLDEKEHPLNTGDLLPIQQTKSYIETNQILNEEVDVNDPILGEQLHEELRLQLMYLYPFAENVITNSTLWIQVLSSSYTEVTIDEENEQIKAIIKWQNKMQKYTKSMIQSFKNSE